MKRSETWGERAAIVAETYEGKKEWQNITGNHPLERRKRRALDVQRRDLSWRAITMEIVA
jgi:hypothetical protein